MRPGNTCRAAGRQQSTTYIDVLRGALSSSLFVHHLSGQRIHRAQALPLGIVRHRTPPIGIVGLALRLLLHFTQPIAKVEVGLPPIA